MKENQNIEYKEVWKDEYLKWVCGFANGQGGTLAVGVNDQGEVVGLDNAARLMEELPNKVRDLLGLVVEVNLRHEEGKEYIEIEVPAYPYPISYRGHHYQRSGATNQELQGLSLDRFLLRRQGITWDSVPMPDLTPDQLDASAIDLFRRKALRSRRMDELDLEEDNAALLDKLRLTEKGHLKRAAALLFHPDPERYVTGAYIKIGFFLEDADLRYQDEVHGCLFHQVKATLDLITTKYMRALISYEGIQRVETLPVPREALREALLNAVVHKAYESLTPIQIAVYEDKIEICNCGYLPEDWTIDNLLRPHRSRPYNPDVANTFFRSGEIEAWGRGIQRIITACRKAGSPDPEFTNNGGELWTTFPFRKQAGIPQTDKETDNESVQAGVQAGVQDSVQNSGIAGGIVSGIARDVELTEKQISIVGFCKEPRSSSEILRKANVGDSTNNRKRYIYDLIEAGLLEMTIPEKPTHPQQRYRRTKKPLQ